MFVSGLGLRTPRPATPFLVGHPAGRVGVRVDSLPLGRALYTIADHGQQRRYP